MVSITLTLVLLLVPHTSGGSNTAVNCGGQSVIFPDVDRGLVCGECKVLVDNFQSYGSCNAYCQTIGRGCAGAWEEQCDNCQVQYAMSCAANAGGSTSDALCECSATAPPAPPQLWTLPDYTRRRAVFSPPLGISGERRATPSQLCTTFLAARTIAQMRACVAERRFT